jgi:hypothetical protein
MQLHRPTAQPPPRSTLHSELNDVNNPGEGNVQCRDVDSIDDVGKLEGLLGLKVDGGRGREEFICHH